MKGTAPCEHVYDGLRCSLCGEHQPPPAIPCRLCGTIIRTWGADPDHWVCERCRLVPCYDCRKLTYSADAKPVACPSCDRAHWARVRAAALELDDSAESEHEWLRDNAEEWER